MYSKSKMSRRRLKNKTRKNKTRKNKTKARRIKRGGTKRRMRHSMRGGTSHLVGAPYNAACNAQPQGNYYAYNNNVEAWPEQSNAVLPQNMKGGMRRGRKKMRGGGISEFVTTLFPQELVNIGRSFPASMGHMYDRFNGSLSSPSSMVYPTQQPLAGLGRPDAGRMMTPPDMLKMYNNNNNLVSKI